MKKILLYLLCFLISNCSVPTNSETSAASTTIEEFTEGKSIIELNYNNRCGESIYTSCNNSIFGSVGNRNFDGFYISNGDDNNNIGEHSVSQHKVEIRLTNNVFGKSILGQINQRRIDIKVSEENGYLNLNGEIGGSDVSIRIKSSNASVATGNVGNQKVSLNHRYEIPTDNFDEFETTNGGQIYGTSDDFSPFIVLLIILYSQHSEF